MGRIAHLFRLRYSKHPFQAIGTRMSNSKDTRLNLSAGMMSAAVASSAACKVQTMRVGANAWSAQYHVEVEADTVENWGEIPAYARALEDSLGEGGLQIMKRDSDAVMDEFASISRQMYKNFMAQVG